MNDPAKNIKTLGELIKKYSPDLSFTLFEIGAREMKGMKENFYHLLDVFPKSKLIGFEADAAHCEMLNKKAAKNIQYYPIAIGKEDGEQTFYETEGGECSSLYKPNAPLLSKFIGLDNAVLKEEHLMKVSSLDSFIKENNIDSVDFIKIDVQGAELDIFKGGVKALKETVLIVTEVEFIPLYENQPLFGDVSSYLTSIGLMFHKFLGMGGRALKPVVVGNNINTATQHLWSDGVFIKDIMDLEELTPDALLKLSILAFMYGSPDLTYICFKIYDEKLDTDLLQSYKKLGAG